MEKIIEAAKKEGKVVAGGPPTSVLRQMYKETFEKVRFYGEDIITEWREPAGEFARKILNDRNNSRDRASTPENPQRKSKGKI